MVLIAATATALGGSSMGGLLLSVVALAVWTVVYALACWWWPYTACKTCRGTGKRKSPSGTAWRKCRHCKGTAARLRTGRRVFNYLHVTKKETD
jgi:hypothetical protein